MEQGFKSIREKHLEFVMEKQSCPSYVELYTKTRRDVILVCKKNKISTHNSEKSHGIKNDKDDEEIDLTGSPLKLDLSLHTTFNDTYISDETHLWTKDESNHVSIPTEKARAIANQFNKLLSESPKEETLPMWLLCNPTDEVSLLLLMVVESDDGYFRRGIVQYDSCKVMDDIDVEKLVEDYAIQEKSTEDMVNILIDCKYTISGVSYGSRTNDELLNAPHGAATQLHCEWSSKTLQIPYISCKSNFEQEVIIGHLGSPCTAIWKSVCALYNLNQMLVDMTAAGISAVDLETAVIRPPQQGEMRSNTTTRLNELLNQTEMYAYTAEYPTGGCTCITEETTSLRRCLNELSANGSSNDFTYQLWDILRDCETAEELITLLIQALKFISSGKIRPFIDVNNKTYLSKLILKLSRGHSQSAKVLKNLRASPPQALSLVAQVGTEKTMWEYTKIMSLLEHSFFIAGIWNNDARTHESIETINQTIQDMTMSGGDFTLNPFDSLSTHEHSIRLDCESFYDEDPNELTVDDFASLKKHGIVSEKKDVNEVPIIADEIDISPWKNLLMRFAQVHVCLEHLFRAESSLRANFANFYCSTDTFRFNQKHPQGATTTDELFDEFVASLKPIATRLLEQYISEKSPVKSVGQLLSDPVQRITMPIANNIVQDHLKKPALWYRVELTRKENAKNGSIKFESKVVHLFTQQEVFPPPVWHILEELEVTDLKIVGEELKYYHTKYTSLSNKLKRQITLT